MQERRILPNLRLTLDHGDVVGAVADGERDGLLVPLDELHNLRLLERGHATTYHSCSAEGIKTVMIAYCDVAAVDIQPLSCWF